ncbi:MAG: glucose-6-phosphate dehydrogenase [Candidatus Hydrogenedentes bacterium]|nr:glucose-6-phosphate dehydrogenase [Candidatus Hydrogenedentota bacterium]
MSQEKSTAYQKEPLSIVVIGASGDLAQRKIYPALFALYCQKLLPDVVHIVGFARSEMSNTDFRTKVSRNLTCRYSQEESNEAAIKSFLERCTYVAGQYNEAESFRQLHKELQHLDPDGAENRIFYMSIPPFLFMEVAHALKAADLVNRAENRGGWTRAVIEKPFGEDRQSSDELTSSMGQVFTEKQTYRIDHYLGKEVIQNLMVLRFANMVFDPIWDRASIHDVRITWMEDLSLEGRAGYFDEYGIIRDVMQNHLLQMVALMAMEPPVSLFSGHVRDEKVKALRAIAPVGLNDIVVGQYSAGAMKGKQHFGYLDEPGVPKDSITPTYAAAVLQVNNRRWDGVPFLIRAGKGLSSSMTEIRLRFREVPGNLFKDATGHLSKNELVIRVQPDAGIAFHIVNRVPGLGMQLAESNLNLRYESAFQTKIPDAYESLLLDVVQGDKSLFIRADELEAAWDIFTPILHTLAKDRIKPEPYTFGSNGPASADALAARFNVKW